MIKLSERSNYDIRFIWIKDFFPETSFANLFKNTLNQDTQVKEGEVCNIEDSSPNPSSIRPALWLRVTHLVSNDRFVLPIEQRVLKVQEISILYPDSNIANVIFSMKPCLLNPHILDVLSLGILNQEHPVKNIT